MADSHADANSTDVIDLRVEYETSPDNAPTSEPRFSWRADVDRRGATQSAYRILVARSREAITEERGDLWDSGRVESSVSTNVCYDGVPLSSDTQYYWSVRVWNEDGTSSEWADPARFATALGRQSGWEGDWIGHRPGAGDSNGYRSQWHPADADEQEWVQVDLGEPAVVERIVLHPATPFDGPETPDGMEVSPIYAAEDPPDIRSRMESAAGFGFPTRYRVEVADDPAFSDPRTVVDRTDGSQENPGSTPVSLDLDGVECRAVRVVAVELYGFDPNEPPRERGPQVKTEYLGEERSKWQTFALGSLEVETVDEDVAVGSDVSASSSFEAEAWGRDHLVDGTKGSETAPGSPLLRTDLSLSKEVKRARVHVCGLGYGELYVNGKRIGDEVLDPGWTHYDERVLYNTHDITDHLHSGENALGIWLGRGWFSRNALDWTGHGSPRAILQLNVEYEDGTTRSVSTDGSWRATESPIVENDIYDGEVYDARAEQDGWAEPGFDDSDWTEVSVVEAPDGDLLPQRTPPIRVTETLEPVDIQRSEEGTIVDFGQNLVGWVELTVEGAEPGDEVTLNHAETLLEDGSLDKIDLRSADATDTYVANGADREVYHPRFTYHGFRYVQVTDYPGDLTPGDIQANVVHTDVDTISSFDCSNEDLSQVQQNARWGLRGNLHGVLTDCPQRDERFGWTGDNHIAARALCYNFDSARFYEKWMDDHEDVRSEHGYVADTVPAGFGTVPEDPTWGITQVTVPWHLYRHYGDVMVLERHYEGMRQYVNFWWGVSDNGVIPDEYGNYGDWLAFENNDGSRGLPYDLFNTAFQYHTTDLFARIADILGHDEDAQRYRERAEEIEAAFNDAFFDADAKRYGPGTQSSYAVPLYFGLVTDEHLDDVVENLVEKVRSDSGKLQSGFLGTRPLVHTLVNHGREEVAYEMVSQPERPGWVYMVRQGATTMWERWDSDDRVGDGMNSFNHSPFNFVSEWFHYALAGLRFDDTIRDGVEIAPAIVEDLDWAEGSIDTVDGQLASRWERIGDGLSLTVEIPWNTTATVRIPTDSDEVTVTESGEIVWSDGPSTSLPDGIEDATREQDTLVLALGSGSYQFSTQQ